MLYLSNSDRVLSGDLHDDAFTNLSMASFTDSKVSLPRRSLCIGRCPQSVPEARGAKEIYWKPIPITSPQLFCDTRSSQTPYHVIINLQVLLPYQQHFPLTGTAQKRSRTNFSTELVNQHSWFR